MKWVLAASILILNMQTLESRAENRLFVKRHSQWAISLELSNSNPVAGLQFSIVTEGGITPGALEESVRLTAAGIRVFQHLANDSTLTVVLLGSDQNSLPPGAGDIGIV